MQFAVGLMMGCVVTSIMWAFIYLCLRVKHRMLLQRINKLALSLNQYIEPVDPSRE